MNNNNNIIKLVLYKVIAPLTFSIAVSNIAHGHGLLKIYQLAAKKDPQVQQAFADFKSVEQNIPIAVSELLPAVTLNAGISYDKVLDFTSVSSGRNPAVNSNYFSVNLTQPLFYWDRIQRYLQSELEVQRSIHDLEVAKEDLLTRVAEGYFNVLEAEDTLEFVSTERKSVKQLYDEAQERFDVGLIPSADVDEAKARYDLQTADEIDAKNQVLARYDELMEIVGEKVDHLSVLTPKFKPSTPKPTEAKKWLQMAMDRNHTYASQRLTKLITEKNEDIAFAGHMPYADATAQYRGVDSNQSLQIDDISTAKGYLNSYGWALEAGIEVFGGGGTQATVEQAEFNTLAEGYNSERIRRETVSNTTQSYRNVTTNIKQIYALEQAVESGLSALEATKASYEVGTRASIDVLDRLTDLYQQKQRLSEARYQYIKNVIELKRLSGVLTNKDILTIDKWLIAKSADAKKLDKSNVKANILQTIEKVDNKKYKKLKNSGSNKKIQKVNQTDDKAKIKPSIKATPSKSLMPKEKPTPIKALEEKLKQLEAQQLPKDADSKSTVRSRVKEIIKSSTIKADSQKNESKQEQLPFDTKTSEDKVLKNLETELLKSIDKDYKPAINEDSKTEINQAKDSNNSATKNKPVAQKDSRYLEPVEDTSQREDAPFASEEKQDKKLQELESELMRIIEEGDLNNN